MASKWLLAGITVLSACGGGAMREIGKIDKIGTDQKAAVASGKCKSNSSGFDIEIGYRNKSSNMLGYPDHIIPFTEVGENQFEVSEVISLKTVMNIDPELEPVFIFPERCFNSILKSVTYKHSEIRPDQDQVIFDTRTYEADKQNQMQFSLLDAQNGNTNNIFPGSIQKYEAILSFEDNTEVKLSIQAVIEPNFPDLQIVNQGYSGFSNSAAEWSNWGANWAAPRVFEALKITNPSDRPLVLWLSSASTFTLRIGSIMKTDENKILNADGYFSIHSVTINGAMRDIPHQGAFSFQINPKETVHLEWIVSPSSSNSRFMKFSEIENFDVVYRQGYGALFGRDSRSIGVTELNPPSGGREMKQIYSAGTGDGHLFWNSFPFADVNFHSWYVVPGIVMTGR